MLDSERIYHRFRENGIQFFTGVPDSLLKDFAAFLANRLEAHQHIIAANEGGAVGLAVGHYLATGKPATVYMQNSGQGNAVNPLLSLADPEVYGVPMILLVGWRGEPGKKDEPQHIKQGRVMMDLFRAMEIPCAVLPEDEEEAFSVIDAQIRLCIEAKTPVALVVPSGTFSPCSLDGENGGRSRPVYSLKREDAIGCIVQSLNPEDTVVASTGKISRELYEYRARYDMGHARDFLTVGGMGHASSIAMGIACSCPDRLVFCLDGDGAALMHLGTLGIIAAQKCANFRHILLNNGAHDSVGGQPTVGFDVDFCQTARSLGYQKAMRVDTLEALKAALPEFHESAGPVLLEIRVCKGARSDLGRPESTPAQNKQELMEFLKS